MSPKTQIIAAFCGTGKSYLCNNFPDTYKEIECWKYRTGDFPTNYIQDVLKENGKVKYLFISTDPVILKELNKFSIAIQLVYPLNELRNEYLDRYINRDDSYDFIGTMMKNWDTWIDKLKEQTYCKHYMLKTGEYLSDIIKEG